MNLYDTESRVFSDNLCMHYGSAAKHKKKCGFKNGNHYLVDVPVPVVVRNDIMQN